MRGTILRKRSGEVLRKLTCYLPVDLYRRLGHAAVDADSDMSAITVEAIRRFLDEK